MLGKERTRYRLAIIGLLVALASVCAGFALATAAVPSGNGTVGLCRLKQGGDARIVADTTPCRTTEQKILMRSYDPVFARISAGGTTGGRYRHALGAGKSSTGQYEIIFD